MRERPSLDAPLKVGSLQLVNGVTNWVAFVATFLSFLWPLEPVALQNCFVFEK